MCLQLEVFMVTKTEAMAMKNYKIVNGLTHICVKDVLILP